MEFHVGPERFYRKFKQLYRIPVLINIYHNTFHMYCQLEFVLKYVPFQIHFYVQKNLNYIF